MIPGHAHWFRMVFIQVKRCLFPYVGLFGLYASKNDAPLVGGVPEVVRAVIRTGEISCSFVRSAMPTMKDTEAIQAFGSRVVFILQS